jgi:hypothetical protein
MFLNLALVIPAVGKIAGKVVAPFPFAFRTPKACT